MEVRKDYEVWRVLDEARWKKTAKNSLLLLFCPLRRALLIFSTTEEIPVIALHQKCKERKQRNLINASFIETESRVQKGQTAHKFTFKNDSL